MTLYNLGRGYESVGTDVVDKRLDEMKPGAILRLMLVAGTSMWHGRQQPLDGKGHLFAIIATNEDGFNSGRRRYAVACTTCERLMHEATTGPLERIEQHLREVQRDAQ